MDVEPWAVGRAERAEQASRFREQYPGRSGSRLVFIGCVPMRLLASTEGRPRGPAVKALVDVFKDPEGAVPPVVVEYGEGRKYDIIDGHHRVEAAKRVGLRCAPALLALFEDEEFDGVKFTEASP